MSQEWGRNEHAGEWPNRHPLWRYAVMFLALVSVAAVCVYRYAEVWTPLQQFYLKSLHPQRTQKCDELREE